LIKLNISIHDDRRLVVSWAGWGCS